MHLVALRRSLAAAAAITLLTIPSAFAETIEADTDLVTAGPQNVVDLGTALPGTDIPVDVYFTLTCSGTSHVDGTQIVKLTPSTRTIPGDGGFSVGSLLFGLSSAWPADGDACPAGLPPTIGGPLHMSITTPTTPGQDYRFFFTWTPTVTPTTATDAGTFEGVKPSMTFIVDVADGAANTAPTLTLPSDSTVEGNTTGGATAAYTVTAGDAEDPVAPTPSCTPAVGQLLPLGTNTIGCAATDSGGLTTSGSFHITVVDTTAPTLHGMPGDVALTTSDPGGATLTFAKPTATDIVDSSPAVGCSVASGATVPIGDTTVTCTATDASGNPSSAAFHVHVTLASASWDDPVGASAGIVVNGSRTVPVKVQLLLDGRAVTTGDGTLTVLPCGGGSAVMTSNLAIQSNGRWMGHLSTDGLAVGCYRVVASVDGQAIGSFRMDVRGDASASSAKAEAKANSRH